MTLSRRTPQQHLPPAIDSKSFKRPHAKQLYTRNDISFFFFSTNIKNSKYGLITFPLAAKRKNSLEGTTHHFVVMPPNQTKTCCSPVNILPPTAFPSPQEEIYQGRIQNYRSTKTNQLLPPTQHPTPPPVTLVAQIHPTTSGVRCRRRRRRRWHLLHSPCRRPCPRSPVCTWNIRTHTRD